MIRDGYSGGKAAAALLTRGINEHIMLEQDGAPPRGQLWVSVFCNKSGLSETLNQHQLCTPDEFEAFWIGFNQASPFFSMVDVGAGKEAADAKIKGATPALVPTSRSCLGFPPPRVSPHLYCLSANDASVPWWKS
jgi:hypothetical protein